MPNKSSKISEKEVAKPAPNLVDFLEADLARLVARIAIRMPLHRQLAERGLELVVVSVALDFEGFVIAALGRRHSSHPPEFHSEATRQNMQASA
jgi:hypothetical protein